MRSLNTIPYSGIGIGLRTELLEETKKHLGEIDVLEVIAEKFFSDRSSFLSAFLPGRTLIPHGVKLSIGSALPLEPDFLRDMKQLTDSIKAPYYSDHFTITRMGDELDTGHLTPLWYTKETLAHISARVDTIQQHLGVPLVLENITSDIDISEADYEEQEFIARVTEKTGCGLLLDVTNVFINAYNRGQDPLELLKKYPMGAVVQIHLAGGELHHGVFKDTHSQEIRGMNEGVWPLFEYAVAHADVKTVIIERDQNFTDDFEDMILKDLRRARAIVERSQPKQASGDAQTPRYASPETYPSGSVA